MLYSEFVENVGCRENDHNYRIYKILEAAYMNDSWLGFQLDKAEVYSLAEKLVDNTPSAEELEQIQNWKAEAESLKEQIRTEKVDCARYNLYIAESDSKEDRKYWTGCKATCKRSLQYLNSRLATLNQLIKEAC